MTEFGHRILNTRGRKYWRRIFNTRDPNSDAVSEILEVRVRTPTLQYYRSEFGRRIANTKRPSSDAESQILVILEVRVRTMNLSNTGSTRSPSSDAEP